MNPLSSALGRFLERVANQAVALDPMARTRLAELSGRIVRIESTSPPETWWLLIDDAGVRVADQCEETPTVVLRGAPPALAGAVIGLPGATAVLAVDGDETTLEELRAIFAALRPDIAEWLSPLVGQKAADGLAGLAEVGLATLRGLTEALSTEGRRVAGKAARERFVDQRSFDNLQGASQDLVLALDRVQRRIELLEAARDSAR